MSNKKKIKESYVRTFGVEIELLAPGPYSYSYGRSPCRQFKNKLKELGMPTTWKVKYDGSIDVDNWEQTAFEVTSPKLSGSEGLKELKKVVKILRKMRCKVNKTCGTHVHVDVTDLTGEQIIFALSRYAKHEKKIDAVVSPNRRKDRNDYCLSFENFEADPLKLRKITKSNKTKTIKSKIRSLHVTRYYKLNLASFSKFGTLEFRHYQGCLNADKLQHWVLFCLNFVERTKHLSEKVDGFKVAEPELTFKNFENQLDWSSLKSSEKKYLTLCKSIAKNISKYKGGCAIADVFACADDTKNYGDLPFPTDRLPQQRGWDGRLYDVPDYRIVNKKRQYNEKAWKIVVRLAKDAGFTCRKGLYSWYEDEISIGSSLDKMFTAKTRADQNPLTGLKKTTRETFKRMAA